MMLMSLVKVTVLEIWYFYMNLCNLHPHLTFEDKKVSIKAFAWAKWEKSVYYFGQQVVLGTIQYFISIFFLTLLHTECTHLEWDRVKLDRLGYI